MHATHVPHNLPQYLAKGLSVEDVDGVTQQQALVVSSWCSKPWPVCGRIVWRGWVHCGKDPVHVVNRLGVNFIPRQRYCESVLSRRAFGAGFNFHSLPIDKALFDPSVLSFKQNLPVEHTDCDAFFSVMRDLVFRNGCVVSGSGSTSTSGRVPKERASVVTGDVSGESGWC